jgi:hypothetical protein
LAYSAQEHDRQSEQAGKSWSEARLRRELLGAVHGVAKRAGCAVKSIEIEVATPIERAEAIAKASDYRLQAERLTDKAAAGGYRQLAKKVLQEAGLE